MTPYKSTYILALTLISLASCETTIDYNLPKEESKITIDAKLLAGDSVSALVGTTTFALSVNRPAADTNSTVWLYENNVAVAQLKPHGRSKNVLYTTNYIIRENQTYKVEASRIGFKTAYGQQLVREAVPIISTTFDSSSTTLNFTFQDPATKGDNYMISIFENTSAFPSYFTTKDLTIEFFEDDIIEDPFSTTEEKSGYRGYLSDEYFNGKVKSINIKIPEFSAQMNLEVQLWRISSDLYEHLRTKSIAWSSENPFSEPVQIFSNIDNGYGIVGALALGSKQFYP